MNFDFSEEDEELRARVREFLDDRLPADWAGVWQSAQSAKISEDFNREAGERGWLTSHWPPEYGGTGASIWSQTVLQEEYFARHEPRGGQYMGANWIGPTIIKYGTPEQIGMFLPDIAAGLAQWAQLFSEPDAGSDLAALRTKAESRPDGFVVNGEKIWTSYANTAQRGFLLARTNQGEKRHRGISAFLIDMDAPGIEIREIPSSVGWHRFHAVSFTDVFVPRSRLIGPLDKGWQVAMYALPFERVGNARYARSSRILGLLEASASTAESRVDDEICEALAVGRACELLNYRVVAEKERDAVTNWRAAAAFACNAVYEREVAGLAEEVLGPGMLVSSLDPLALDHGEVESFAVRQAPTVTIQAGSYQVQLSIIAEEALGLPRTR